MSRTRSINDDTILDGAVEIISRHGADELTFASLAAYTGLAPATLVQRFHTKQELLFRVAKRCMADAEAVFVEARRSGSALKALHHAINLLTQSIKDAEHFANGLSILQLALKDAELYSLLQGNAQNVRRQIQQLIDEASDTGELMPCDTAALASCIQSTFEGAIITWSIYRQGDVDDWVTLQVENVIKPYRQLKNK